MENGMLLQKELIEDGCWWDLLKISEAKETVMWLGSSSALEDQKFLIKSLVSNTYVQMGFVW